MTEVIGVRFKSVGKIYHFSPAGKKVNAGDYVIVETARGVVDENQNKIYLLPV